MGRQNIQFRGMRHTPSDITGQDGDLLECVNLVHEGGELRPIEMPEQLPDIRANVSEGVADTLAAVHNLSDGKKFIFVSYDNLTSVVVAKSLAGVQLYGHSIVGEEVKWVETVGNTLIIGTDKSVHYAKYKNGQYHWLGDKLPQPVIQFDFKRDSVRHDGWTQDANGFYINEYEPKIFTLMHDSEPMPGGGIAFSVSSNSFINSGNEYKPMKLANTSSENKKILRDGIRSRIVQVLAKADMGNVFIYPFFVRYAVRMYDNNYAMHSAPILMIPSSLTNPLLAYISIESFGDGSQQGSQQYDSDNVGYTRAHDGIRFRPMELIYKFKGFMDASGNEIQDIGDWGDIIKGVDIFLSSQVSSYNEKAWDNLDQVPEDFYCFDKTVNNGSSYVPAPGWKEYGHCYTQNQKINWWDIFTDDSDGQGGERTPIFDYNETITWDTGGGITYECYQKLKIDIPNIGQRQMIEKLQDTNLFYRVKQYSLDELDAIEGYDTRFSTEADDGILERLETLPILEDDYVSRSRMNANVSYNYNQRLVLGNLSLQSPLWYQDAKLWKNYIPYVTIDFVIEKPEKTIVIEYAVTEGNDRLGEYDFGHYLYYPDPDCKKAYVTLYNGGTRYFEVPMNEHTGLHGAYALMPNLKSLWESYDDFTQVDVSAIPTPSTDAGRHYAMSNTIAMSGVANPFYFPASNFKDIGRAKVIGIAANVLDVSYEQWGPFPLYAFCSDGIVAITIDKEGKFGGPVEAVSADVLRTPRGIGKPTLIQASQILVFLTQRGVMGLGYGSKPKLLSEVMQGKHFNPLTELSPITPVPSVLYNIGAFTGLLNSVSDSMAFVEYAKSAFLAYDYAHNRVLMVRPENTYQYVLSLDTLLWSKQAVYTNLDDLQVDSIPEGTIPDRAAATVNLVIMKSAVNNYTEMYLEDTAGYLYRTMDVTEQNNGKQYYQFGYLISRPIRLGTDEYKTLTRVLNRYTHYAATSFVKLALFGSRDGVQYGRVNTLRGMSYQYYIFVVYTYLKPNERYSYLTVDFEPRMVNKLR